MIITDDAIANARELARIRAEHISRNGLITGDDPRSWYLDDDEDVVL